MGRIDWLRDVGTGLGKDVLAIALEIWVNLEGKRGIARIDWAYGAIVADGKDVEGKRKGRAGFVRIDWGEAVCKILLKELIEFGLCTLDFKRTIS